MPLNRVTITGWDDSVDPQAIPALIQKYPFLEIGILVSHNNFGFPRFPSEQWIQQVQRLQRDWLFNMSLHLCGTWVKQLLLGKAHIPVWLFQGCERFQLNFHGCDWPWHSKLFWQSLRHYARHGRVAPWKQRQIIFQLDGFRGAEYVEIAMEENPLGDTPLDTVVLFDTSGGAGVLPAQWPSAVYMETDEHYGYHGYAGGLGPQNVLTELPKIHEASQGASFWIDMERNVRSEDDLSLDLEKVTQVLEKVLTFPDADFMWVPAK